MPEEVLYILFIIMVGVIMVNILCAIDHRKARKEASKWSEEYYALLMITEKKFWKHMGAYDAENGRMYLDLEGIRLVIFEGQIEGWYKP